MSVTYGCTVPYEVRVQLAVIVNVLSADFETAKKQNHESPQLVGGRCACNFICCLGAVCLLSGTWYTALHIRGEKLRLSDFHPLFRPAAPPPRPPRARPR